VLPFFAQVDSVLVKKTNPKTLRKMGANALDQNDPSSAVLLLNGAVIKNPKDGKSWSLLGWAYMKQRDYERSRNAFTKAIAVEPDNQKSAVFYLAMMQKQSGMYDSAAANFKRYRKLKGTEPSLKKIAATEANFCDSAKIQIRKRKPMVVMRLDTTINKVNTEASPLQLDENTMWYSSLRTEKRLFVEEDDTATIPTRRIYKAVKTKGVWKFAGEVNGPFNTADANTGNACFSADGKRLYFSRCSENALGKFVCAIYLSSKEGDKWSEPVKLPEPVNLNNYSSTMPSIGNDPATGNDIVYFVSDRKGGKGKRDIWFTVFDIRKKNFKNPRNAGSKVNTKEDDVTPFFDNETRTLYYSTNGAGGMGGFDVFKASGDGKKFTESINIGAAINTGADEIYYTIGKNRKEGFFVSNRKGGNALKNRTCCDDIYYYANPSYINVKVKGTMQDPNNPKKTLANTLIEVYKKDPITGDPVLIKTIFSDSLGRYKTEVEAGADYFLMPRTKEYMATKTNVPAKNLTRNTTISTTMVLKEKPKGTIFIPNVHYDFDKPTLTPESKKVLDTTLFTLLKTNPDLLVQVESHTDSKGSEAYNFKLSQKRAESVMQYLIAKGINAKRLTAKGFGESKPLVPNENPDGSDNPENRAKNRRTGFTVTGYSDLEIRTENEGED
jgi:outer membrane protein OmpA-like peptidoglycan-associated protein